MPHLPHSFASLGSVAIIAVPPAAGRLLAKSIEAEEFSLQRTQRAQSIFPVVAADAGTQALFTGLNRNDISAEVKHICAGLVGQELDCIEAPNTAGERIFKEYGLTRQGRSLGLCTGALARLANLRPLEIARRR